MAKKESGKYRAETGRTFYETLFQEGREVGWQSAPGKKVIVSAVKRLLSEGRLLKKGSVLDIGCGDGFLLNVVRQHYIQGDMLGIDISKNAIEKAAKSYDGIKFRAADVCALPLGFGKFDLVISYGSLEHVYDTRRLFEVIRSMLKNGALFLFMIPTLGFYRDDRCDEGWYEDLDVNRQLQWNRFRETWEAYFRNSQLILYPDRVASSCGAIKPQCFYFGHKEVSKKSRSRMC